jgi:hypothetical protein
MNPLFHYEVRITGVRYNSNDDIEFKWKTKEFNDENPLISRKKSLDFYENYISGILTHLGYSYISDRESRQILDSLFKKGSSKRVPIKDFDENISDIHFLGIGVFFVLDKSLWGKKTKKFDFSIIGREHLIHGIGYMGTNNKITPEYLMLGLYYETVEYERNGFDLTGLKKIVEFYEYDINESDYSDILPTPFNWTGFDIPYKTEDDREEEDEKNEDIPDLDYEKVVQDGETDQVEFKSTLKYNIETNKGDSTMTSIIGKTLCGFLNSRGGILFIGVNDDGNLIGLSHDFSLNKKKPKDSFVQEFDNVLRNFLPLWVKDYISGGFQEIDGIEVFVVWVSPSKNEPVFFKGQKGKEFFIRLMGSTKQLDVEEFHSYWKNHWNNNKL